MATDPGALAPVLASLSAHQLRQVRTLVDALLAVAGAGDDGGSAVVAVVAQRQRAVRGVLPKAILAVLAEKDGLLSSEIFERVRAKDPTVKKTSVNPSLSRLRAEKKLVCRGPERLGRYYLASRKGRASDRPK